MKIDIQPLKHEIAKAKLLAIRADGRVDTAKTEYEAAFDEHGKIGSRLRSLEKLLQEYESLCASDPS